MVNKALEEMITSEHGEAVWEEIREKASVDVDVFVSSQGYPDALTYALVVASADVLKIEVPSLLERFGVHWIVETAQRGYGDLMAASGKSLREFLINLPNFHARVSLIFPHLEPPMFACSEVASDSLRLHYRSKREGLAPFVIGLLRGLGRLWDAPITIEHAAMKAAGADHDEFLVKW